jgi:hypothetical protein
MASGQVGKWASGVSRKASGQVISHSHSHSGAFGSSRSASLAVADFLDQLNRVSL